MNTRQYKKMFLILLLASAAMIPVGIILMKATIAGVIIIIFGFFAILTAFLELHKFYEFERYKEDFSIKSIAKFSNNLKRYKSGKLKKEEKDE